VTISLDVLPVAFNAVFRLSIGYSLVITDSVIRATQCCLTVKVKVKGRCSS